MCLLGGAECGHYPRAVVQCVNPVGDEIRIIGRPVTFPGVEEPLPRVTTGILRLREPVPVGEIFPHGMSLVTVHAAFALLQVHGVRGQIPVDDRVAVRVEVQPFLPDGADPIFRRSSPR
jgi:hypothetical protein